MTASECRENVRKLFEELYPGCVTIYSYATVRPPLPYVVLDFQNVTTSNIEDSFDSDGILRQKWYKTIQFTAELVAKSKIVHGEDSMSGSASTVVDDLDRSIQFIRSAYVSDKCRALNIAISATGSPEQINNVSSGVERARCSYSVDFIEETKEYASIHPADGEYTEDRRSSASKRVADMEAGWFTEVNIKPQYDE